MKRIKHKHAKYAKGESDVLVKSYANGRSAIILLDAETGEPEMTATVNLPEENQFEGDVFIKDYSENEGILQDLIDNNIVANPVAFIDTGHVSVAICKLLVENPETNLGIGSSDCHTNS